MPLKVKARADDSSKHESDVTTLIFHKGLLYSAADDGKIKLWDTDLKLKAETVAHPCSVFCLTANDTTLYSCSNDGTIKAWTLDELKDKGTIAKIDGEFWKIKYSYTDSTLYAGDDQGTIRTYRNDKLFGQVSLLEPTKDMLVVDSVIYTAHNLDIVISEIIKGGEKERYINRKNMMGRAPLTLAGGKLFFVDREGKDIIMHENSTEVQYKELAQAKNAHELIIMALLGTKNESGTFLYSGGWDKNLKQWKIEDNTIKANESCAVDIVINCFASGERNFIFAAGSDGNILRIDV